MNSFDPTKPAQTRDGRSALIVAAGLNLDGGDSIIAVVEGSARTYRPDGRFLPYETNDDLVNTPETREVFLNVYDRDQFPKGHVLRSSGMVAEYNSAETADTAAAPKALRFKVTYEDDTPIAVELRQ